MVLIFYFEQKNKIESEMHNKQQKMERKIVPESVKEEDCDEEMVVAVEIDDDDDDDARCRLETQLPGRMGEGEGRQGFGGYEGV